MAATKIRKGLKIDEDTIVQFHAPLADADGNGNDIVATYARKADLQSLSEQGTRQNEAISRTQETANEAKQDSNTATSKVLTLEGKALNVEEQQALLNAEIEATKKQLSRLNAERQAMSKNKGAFASIVALEAVVPSVNDFAMVLPPEEGTDLPKYYGSRYLGTKADHLTEWAADGRPALGNVYTGDDDTVYKVIKPITIATLADQHHIEDSALVEDGIIAPLDYGGSPYLAICTTEGKWEVTDIRVTFAVAPHILSEEVMDGEVTQERLNLTRRVNDILANSNIGTIETSLNAVIDTLNELQRVVAVQRESDKLPRFIGRTRLMNYRIAGDIHNNIVGLSPMPIITEAEIE